MKLKNLPWIPFVLFAVAIGFYPAIYYFVDMHSKGLLSSKPKELLNSNIWYTLFYVHITTGGLAMLTGWSQFSNRLRGRYLNIHRFVGKVYVLSVLLSSCAGLYIAFFASGGIVCVIGFGSLALLWFFTDIKAYTSIRKLQIDEHERWMIRNYALTFAAVTLRIWLPLATSIMRFDFTTSYRVISWLCWVPNLIVAELIITRKNNKLELA
ncbi:DUF2306 domain-containing protein [Mucilaginibacter sp. L3T2-6]|uniref:DUF2306 domain-containing protein n=1 Tax=Mucilaginibacter sp. L3T2-6 TaxID=3062491 RepID=UPI002676AC89|nr:DUF2306 domain-containing protein [Mucilaginibacter sp. L3T2-6]MDO3641707.1 DUF2306 domain-containing protein [Mucilaginibacter sp. L3T2-6]MDV6214201.1 DUF2306 domain-containing protein [Mucilaginibacter sp. L3T2-6]